jgi:N utilization substance protein B
MNTLKNVREFVFQYLYHLSLPVFDSDKQYFSNEFNADALEAEVKEFKNTSDIELSTDHFNKALGQIKKIMLVKNNLDKEINPFLKNWKLERLSKVDYTLLLIGTFELTIEKLTPAPIIINEAIELAKTYGTKESPSFINGLLDNIKNNIK